MKLRFLAGLPLLLGGCAVAGAPMATTLTATPLSPRDDVFSCVRQQLAALEYRQTSLDVTDRRITAKKIDEKTRRPDVRFVNLSDRLVLQVQQTATGGTELTVEAHTFVQYATQRGYQDEEEKASAGANLAAQIIVQQCGK